MDKIYLKHLINKYISGTATEDERNELLAWYRTEEEEELILPYENIEEEESAKEKMHDALLRQINKQKNTTNKLYYVKIAAAAAVLIGAFLLLYRYLPAQHPETATIVFSTVTTQRGERKIIKLTDGSVIYLNAGSFVRLPSAFNGPLREIYFEGEAFFEIAKDKNHPFIVHTGKTRTRVLGTSFNITARNNQPEITVALITGKVAFTDGKEKSDLLPGHLVAYNKRTGKLKLKTISNIQAVTNRHNGDYEYNNVKVAAIVEDLNINFNANITVAGAVKNCDFFGRIKQGESVESFLKKLATIENAKIIKSGTGYLIKGGGCN
ncbi:MAG: FecR family protein [Bacteroidota bacterium]|nr:FecR family protein [Bacteroidota bacterium]